MIEPRIKFFGIATQYGDGGGRLLSGRKTNEATDPAMQLSIQDFHAPGL